MFSFQINGQTVRTAAFGWGDVMTLCTESHPNSQVTVLRGGVTVWEGLGRQVPEAEPAVPAVAAVATKAHRTPQERLVEFLRQCRDAGIDIDDDVWEAERQAYQNGRAGNHRRGVELSRATTDALAASPSREFRLREILAHVAEAAWCTHHARL